jgi:hypothetical protein
MSETARIERELTRVEREEDHIATGEMLCRWSRLSGWAVSKADAMRWRSSSSGATVAGARDPRRADPGTGDMRGEYRKTDVGYEKSDCGFAIGSDEDVDSGDSGDDIEPDYGGGETMRRVRRASRAIRYSV